MGEAGDERGEEALEPPDDGPDLPLGAPPHPLDRLWLHPSELAPFVGASSGRPSRPVWGSRPMWVVSVVAGATGAILTIAALGAIGALHADKRVTETSATATTIPVITARTVALSVGPAVVAVSVRDGNRTRRGSGVCVERAGEVLTSDRLVGTSGTIEVTTSDGVQHPARVLGRDGTTDLALLHLDISVPIAQFAAHAPKVLDEVWVVGAPDPGDSSPWMSSGAVASTDSLVSIRSGPVTSGLLETAAPASSVSSGGALVDRWGDVTGIILSPVGSERMTYAMPIASALSIAGELAAQGHVTHGALGIAGTDQPAGPTVTALAVGGPAARAGLRVGDVLLAVDGHEVDSMGDVMALVRDDQPGRHVVVSVQRGKKTLTVHATLTGMVAP